MKISTTIKATIGAVALGAVLAAPNAYAISAQAAIDVAANEKTQLQNASAAIKASVAEFKDNLAKIKSATIEEKRTFAVDVYAKADVFFTKEHTQFMAALNTAAASGVDVSAAQAHFDKAWQLLLQANTHAKALADVTLSSTTRAQAKTYAKDAEQGYKQVKSELRAGALALKAAIIAHYNLSTPAVEANGSVSASVSTQ